MPEQRLPGGAAPPRRRFPLFWALIAGSAGYLAVVGAGGFFLDRSEAERTFQVMTTAARVVVLKGSATVAPARLAEMAEQAIREVDMLMGPGGEESDVRRLNAAPARRWVEVSPHTWNVVMDALRWHRLSGGAFDPTIWPVKRLFNFKKRAADTWPGESELAAARAAVGADKLLYDREGMRLAWDGDGMAIDLGAIAKGYGVDRAIEVLEANGAESALVDVGGEVRVLGMKPGPPPAPWRAGIRHPRGGGIVEEFDLTGAVATSGDYENFFFYDGRRFTHVIDPRDGLPLAEGVASVTVRHPGSCMAADALATTMMVLGPEEGKAFLADQALGLFSDGVRVDMFLARGGGLLKRVAFLVDQGVLTVEESFPGDPDPPR